MRVPRLSSKLQSLMTTWHSLFKAYVSPKVEVITPGGSRFYLPRAAALKLLARKEATRLDFSTIAITEKPSERFVDYSKRTQWKPWISGLVTVMEMR